MYFFKLIFKAGFSDKFNSIGITVIDQNLCGIVLFCFDSAEDYPSTGGLCMSSYVS